MKSNLLALLSELAAKFVPLLRAGRDKRLAFINSLRETRETISETCEDMRRLEATIAKFANVPLQGDVRSEYERLKQTYVQNSSGLERMFQFYLKKRTDYGATWPKKKLPSECLLSDRDLKFLLYNQEINTPEAVDGWKDRL